MAPASVKNHRFHLPLLPTHASQGGPFPRRTPGWKISGLQCSSPFTQASLPQPFQLGRPPPFPTPAAPAGTDRHTAGPQGGPTHQNARATRRRDPKTETQLTECLPAQAGARAMSDSPGDGSAIRLRPHFQGRIEAILPGNGLIDQPEPTISPATQRLAAPPTLPGLCWALAWAALSWREIRAQSRGPRARPWGDKLPLDKSQWERRPSKDSNTGFSGVLRYSSVIVFLTFTGHLLGAFPPCGDCEKYPRCDVPFGCTPPSRMRSVAEFGGAVHLPHCRHGPEKLSNEPTVTQQTSGVAVSLHRGGLVSRFLGCLCVCPGTRVPTAAVL